MRGALLGVALVISLLLAFVAPGSAQSVSGVVLNQVGEKVDSAEVTLRDASGEVQSETFSDYEGAYQLSIPRSGEYHIHTHAVGHLPTVSLLFALEDDGLYQVDVEVQTAPADRLEVEIPEERYMEWVERRFSGRATPDVIVVAGQEWLDLALGRDMVEALTLADFPQVSLRRTYAGFCAHSGSSTDCMSVLRASARPVPRLRDIRPEDLDGVIYMGPTLRHDGTDGGRGSRDRIVNASIVLFLRGYLAYYRR